MSREFKFRVWDKLAQHMIYPDKGYQGHYVLDLNGRFHNLQNGSGGDDYVVMEYTGLKDQHNKEIYEGDIMASRGNYMTGEIDENGNFPDLKNVVIWNVKSTRFALKPIEDYVRQLRLRQLGRPIPVYLDSAWACSLTTFKEVIGNIFENPELLKQYES